MVEDAKEIKASNKLMEDGSHAPKNSLTACQGYASGTFQLRRDYYLKAQRLSLPPNKTSAS